MSLIIRTWQTGLMVTAKTDLPSLIARYAGTFHDVIGDGHHVASPLGAWLVLALCAPAAAGGDAATLTDVLGGAADEVSAAAADLLAAPHPLVAAAAAVWNRPGAGEQRWLAGLPAAVERGDIPSQGQLDQWARDHTFGLIDKFPLQVDPSVYLLLASALATKVSWDDPFDLVPGAALGESSPWSKELAQVLRSPNRPSHSAFITTTKQAGDVAVHAARARGGLLVASVIAGADVARADVLAAAHEIAIATARQEPVGQRALSSLAVGDSPLWSVRDEPSTGNVAERCLAVIPAWSATDSHDLSDRRLGFAAAADAIGNGAAWKATQAVMARYTKVGFEAAAVTAFAVAAAMLRRPGLLRTVELRFGHPYAVVAVAASDTSGAPGSAAAGPAGPWDGLPVFSAWVAEPQNAE
jgi:hypothetical protein